MYVINRDDDHLYTIISAFAAYCFFENKPEILLVHMDNIQQLEHFNISYQELALFLHLFCLSLIKFRIKLITLGRVNV